MRPTTIGRTVTPSAAASNIRARARQVATSVGVDPDVFERLVGAESSFDPRAVSKAGAQGLTQLMPATSKALGITDPYDVDQNLNGGATYLKQQLAAFGGDYRNALAAYNAGAGAVKQYGGVPPYAETQAYVQKVLGGPQGGPRDTYAAEQPALRPSQFGDATLTPQEAASACGPAAAVAFAHVYGRNPTLREAVDLAKSVGWSEATGMPGVRGQKALLDKMGIPSTLDPTANWDAITKHAVQGQPVTVSTADHYFVVDGYDPAARAYHVGTSGTDTRLKKDWMTADEINGFGGVNGALYVDHPLAGQDAATGAGLTGQIPATTAGTTATYRSPRFKTKVTVGPDGQPAVDVALDDGKPDPEAAAKSYAAFESSQPRSRDDEIAPSATPAMSRTGTPLVDPWSALYQETINPPAFKLPVFGGST